MDNGMTRAPGTARDAGRRRHRPRRGGARRISDWARLRTAMPGRDPPGDALPCIACLVLGAASPTPLEVPHPTSSPPSRFVRPPTAGSAPLCCAHQHPGPPRGGPGPATFWSRLGLTPAQTADFRQALDTAFREQRDRRLVIQLFASLALGNRSRATSRALRPRRAL
jgi:hypothetical protein